MSTLYLITGPAGVGKSTISNKIAALRKKSALIEGDDIYHQVVGSYVSPWKEGNHLDIFWDLCELIIKKYLDNDYDVVFNYIIKKDNLKRLQETFKNYKIKFIVLLVSEETILKRDALRPEDCQMKERCLVLLNNFINEGYNEKYLLYTDNLTIEETVNTVEKENRFLIVKYGKPISITRLER